MVAKAFSPPLKLDLDIAKVRAARDGQLAIKITDNKSRATLLEQSLPLQILPRDHLMLSRFVGRDSSVRTRTNSLAWITPNAKEIDAFLAKAKARAKFVGEQGPTLPQVQALFEELRAAGVSYVMDPDVFDERGFFQRTRLPAEVLSSTNAQCLEGTLLYATLLEAIGLKPILVYVPGHAFVGWKPSRFDKVKAPALFLETTMTGGKATFEQVIGVALSEVQEHRAAFERGVAEMLDVAALRGAGYKPMPF